jgi:hypothetical protein
LKKFLTPSRPSRSVLPHFKLITNRGDKTQRTSRETKQK